MRSYSHFYDLQTKVQFSPVLDLQTGCHVAVAEVSAELADQFKERRGFEVLTREQYFNMITAPEDPAPAESATGNPLTDSTAAKESEGGRDPATLDYRTLVLQAGALGIPRAASTPRADLEVAVRTAQAALSGPPPPPGS